MHNDHTSGNRWDLDFQHEISESIFVQNQDYSDLAADKEALHVLQVLRPMHHMLAVVVINVLCF